VVAQEKTRERPGEGDEETGRERERAGGGLRGERGEWREDGRTSGAGGCGNMGEGEKARQETRVGRRASECARVHAREKGKEEERQRGGDRARGVEGHVWKTGQRSATAQALQIAGKGSRKSTGMS